MKRHAMRKTCQASVTPSFVSEKIAELIALRRQRRDAGLSGLREKIRVNFDHRPHEPEAITTASASLRFSTRARRPVALRSIILS
jgi:hypothetical protein